MTDRVSKIVLRGDISDLQAKMVAAGKSVSDFGKRITDQDKKSQQFRRGLTQVGDAAGKMGLVAAAGLTAIVATTAKFDKQMSAVKAATHESADSMEALRRAAIKAGADTAFSASEAAQGIENLAKAGVQTTDILGGGLQGALDLAAAGTIDVGDAAETAATAMSQFGLSGKDVPHIADLLAAAAGKAQGEVSDMSQALNQVGLVANQTGLSIEETTGGLAAFAHAGLLGSDAGTSFKTMLLALVPKSEEAGKLMESLGFSAFDAQGNFVGLAETAQRLQDALKGMTAEQRQSYLQTIFGTDAIRSANVLYEQGAAGIDKWIGKVNDQGYAAETAATKLDNLSGDLEAFKGSLETALIGSGEGSQGMFRSLVQGATGAVNSFNNLSDAGKNSTSVLLALTAATGGGVWFTSRVIQSVSSTRDAIKSMGIEGGKTAGALRGLARAGIALAGLEAAGAALDVIETKAAGAAPSVDKLTSALIHLNQAKFADQFSGIGDALNSIDKGGFDGFVQDFNALGEKGGFAGKALAQGLGGFAGITDDMQAAGVEAKRSAQAFDSLDKALAGVVTSGSPEQARAMFDQLAQSQGLSADQQKQLLALLPGYTDALAGVKNEADLAAAGADGLTTSTGGLTDSTSTNTTAMQDNTQAIKDNVKAMQDKYDANVSAFDAETAYQRALDEGKDRNKEKADLQRQIADIQKGGVKADEVSRLADLQKQLDDYRNTLDKSTVAGQKNRDILSDMAKAWNGLSDKQKNAKGAYADARQALINQAVQFGATRREAKRYADRLLQIPPKVTTQLTLDKQRAEEQLANIKAQYDAIKPKTVTITFKTFRDAALADANRANNAPPPGSSPTRRADGGYISGPGTGTSDSIPAYLSNGEFVIRAAAVDRYGVDFMHELNRMRFAQGGYVDQRAQRTQSRQGFASGGYVSGGLSGGDLDRIVTALSAIRPLYGHQTVMPHNYSEFRRQQDADQRAAEMGAVTFRA